MFFKTQDRNRKSPALLEKTVGFCRYRKQAFSFPESRTGTRLQLIPRLARRAEALRVGGGTDEGGGPLRVRLAARYEESSGGSDRGRQAQSAVRSRLSSQLVQHQSISYIMEMTTAEWQVSRFSSGEMIFFFRCYMTKRNAN